MSEEYWTNRSEADITLRYQEASKEAKELSTAHLELSFPEREERVGSLLDAIQNTNLGEEDRLATIKKVTKELLISDPLTDRQSGIISRWIQYSRVFMEEFSELSGAKRLIKGDWEELSKRYSKLAGTAWEMATSEADQLVQQEPLYRGISFRKPFEQNLVSRHGLVARAFWEYGSFDSMIDHTADILLSREQTGKIDSRTLSYCLIGAHLPISKVAVLRENWSTYYDVDDSNDSSRSFGISTSPHLKTARAYGSVMQINSIKQAIPRYYENGMSDYTLFYYISPDEITWVE